MKKVVSVNTSRCELTGRLLQTVQFRDSFIGRPFIKNNLSDELKARMYFFAVGICHQTYNLVNKELNLFGWDYLEHGFLEIAHQKPDLLSPKYILSITQNELIDQIRPFFSPNHSPDSCTLDRLEERTLLWQNMAGFLSDKKNSVTKILEESRGDILWFYESFKHIEAYSDPLQKKTSFLVKLLEDSGLITIKNPGFIIPVMDYHMQRVLLRTGCVEIEDKQLRSKLLQKILLESDEEIRQSCIEAMKLIASVAQIPVLKMNDIFYMLGRSCCNQKPLCVSNQCDKTPCSLTLTLHLTSHSECLLLPICAGSTSVDYRTLNEPAVLTHFY